MYLAAYLSMHHFCTLMLKDAESATREHTRVHAGKTHVCVEGTNAVCVEIYANKALE